MDNKLILINNKDKIHTTKMGDERIKRNLELDFETNSESFCIEILENSNSTVIKRGKNYYVMLDNYIITINSYSYTIITAKKN